MSGYIENQNNDIYKKIINEKRKIAIWGTGYAGKQTAKALGINEGNIFDIFCFIDSSPKEPLMMGLPVVPASTIKKWSEYFIIIATNDYYDEIKDYLIEEGLVCDEDFIYWGELDKKVILGISGLYHDSAAAIIVNGEIIAAAQEERFTRKKHDLNFPQNAIRYCLNEANINFSKIDAVIYYDNPFLSLDRLICNIKSVGEKDQNLVDRNLRTLLMNKVWIHKMISSFFDGKLSEDKIYVTEHHISHATSAFFPSPFKEAAIITFDGVGEWATSTIGIGINNKISILKKIDYPDSLGLLYSAFTFFCGFKVNSGEYKLMGLAPYGTPVYYDKIVENVITIFDDGSYKLNMDFFEYQYGGNMTGDKLADLFDGPARVPESIITQREMDIAASIQKVTEEIVIKTARYAKKITGMKNVCLAGGTALNCVANGRLVKEGIFDSVWIQPAAGDAGGALGAALYFYYSTYYRRREVSCLDSMKGSYLGPEYNDERIHDFLINNNYKYAKYDNEGDFFNKVAELLSSDKVIGLFQGRMEFGPRALGNRSIIANPTSKDMQSKLNLKIKYRESFRPFAPSVMEEYCQEYFEMKCNSPYMLLTAPVKKERRLSKLEIKHDNSKKVDMLSLVNQCRSDIPAVTHLDYSARIQTVNERQNYNFYHIIKAFRNKTGCACVVNTSFNVRGEPIVCTLEDAYNCFMRTDMDILILNQFILYKEEQPEFIDKQNWRDIYELD